MTLETGNTAPNFTLPATGGNPVTLSSFRGKPVVIFFYPKDDTSGCTTESKDFSSLLPDFKALGVTVIGISPDSLKSHEKFANKHDLSVTLAADEDQAVLEAYGVWQEKSMYGRKYMGVVRTTVLVAPDGTVARIWPKVKVAGHAKDVLAAVRELRA
ncbi:peroxiredoxin [Rhizobium sp. PAMB 3182]